MTRLILLACILCGNLFAALPADTVWEVRPTNGSNLNGGAYAASIADGNSVDYSQQDAAQLSVTDLVNVGAVTTCTSATGGFTDAMQGNFLHLESGTNVTVGFYAITEVTDANTIVLDRAPGNTIVTGTGKIGGATKSLSGQTTNTLAAALLAGHKVWIKNEAWDESATGFATVAVTSSPVVIEGYNSARGDEPTGTNRPLNDRNSAGVPFTLAGGHYHVKHLRATRSNGIGFTVTTGHGCFIVGCRSYNNGSIGFSLAAIGTLINCESDANTTTGVTAATTFIRLMGCNLHDNTGSGLDKVTYSPDVLYCLIEGNAGHGITGTTGNLRITNCTISGNTGASTDGVSVTNATGPDLIINSIFSLNGRDGIRTTTPGGYYADYNNFYGNVGVPRTNFPTGDNDTALDPAFVNAAGGNFSPGTNMKATGFPGLFPGGTSQGYLDQGAVQRQEGGGALSSTF